MHYANGQPAKAGDLVYKKADGPGCAEYIGILISGSAASTTCNVRVLPKLVRTVSDAGDSGWRDSYVTPGNEWYATASELMPLNAPAYPAAEAPAQLDGN
jgi:hypothetical protein